MAIALQDTLPANINVSYSAIYSKRNGTLCEVNLNWTNVVSIIKIDIYHDYGSFGNRLYQSNYTFNELMSKLHDRNCKTTCDKLQ